MAVRDGTVSQVSFRRASSGARDLVVNVQLTSPRASGWAELDASGRLLRAEPR